MQPRRERCVLPAPAFCSSFQHVPTSPATAPPGHLWKNKPPTSPALRGDRTGLDPTRLDFCTPWGDHRRVVHKAACGLPGQGSPFELWYRYLCYSLSLRPPRAAFTAPTRVEGEREMSRASFVTAEGFDCDSPSSRARQARRSKGPFSRQAAQSIQSRGGDDDPPKSGRLVRHFGTQPCVRDTSNKRPRRE
ncbi:unnamed protein product [Lota lota]